MTNREIAKRIADIQWQVYDLYGIDGLPAANSDCDNHESLLEEMRALMADQLYKTSFFDMINQYIINMVDEEFNAHEIAYVCDKLQETQ